MNCDARNARLCEILTEEGREARLFLSDDIAGALSFGDIIVLPIKGMSADRFDGLLTDRQILVTGEDFLRREDFQIKNAVLTAEAAIEIAMSEMPVSLHGCNALVVGFGRIGKLLCNRLASFGASVTASARSDGDFAWIDTFGCKSVHTQSLSGTLHTYDVIFNTVPKMVLPAEYLCKTKLSCVIIDLASKPGGTDFNAAKRLDRHCLWALSLPSGYAPETAARIMRQSLGAILSERNYIL
jgi:dipicolinate synthase subunit A